MINVLQLHLKEDILLLRDKASFKMSQIMCIGVKGEYQHDISREKRLPLLKRKFRVAGSKSIVRRDTCL